MNQTSSPSPDQKPSLLKRLCLALIGPFYSPFEHPPVREAPFEEIPPFRIVKAERKDRPPVVSQPPPEPLTPQPVETLAKYLSLSPKNRYAIRSADEFVATADDLRGQVIELIDHLFVRYPVPLFLYRVMLSDEGLRLVFPSGNPVARSKQWMTQEAPLRRWFYTVAQGGSFAQLVKDTLNKREAHWFLQAPDYHDIETNLRWARVAALGFPPEACDFVMRKFAYELPNLTAERKMDLGRFYTRAWADFEAHELDEIADFIRHRFDDPAFCLAGRTANSVRDLSEAWHRRFERSGLFGSGNRNLSWRGVFPDWEERFGPVLVQVIELTNERALRQEGAHQGHCVGTYAEACRANRSRIVSVRWFQGATETKRLTVEIKPVSLSIVQIRGLRNRRPLPEEKMVLGLWAEEFDLVIEPHAA